jgi:hypothetical protein
MKKENNVPNNSKTFEVAKDLGDSRILDVEELKNQNKLDDESSYYARIWYEQ